MFQLARGLAFAVTVREASPEHHCAEVADLAGRIATELGLSEGVALRCRLGGWLHDIGKLAIPDRVLQAAGDLGRGARGPAHPRRSRRGDIVRRLEALAVPAALFATTTSGTTARGYPDGLAGDDIPIDARIVAAADAWSAIRAGRPYQEALDPARALQQIQASAGGSLDPAVVAALAAVVTAAPEVTSARRGRPAPAERRSEAA